jgi:hypothetical protein
MNPAYATPSPIDGALFNSQGIDALAKAASPNTLVNCSFAQLVTNTVNSKRPPFTVHCLLPKKEIPTG